MFWGLLWFLDGNSFLGNLLQTADWLHFKTNWYIQIDLIVTWFYKASCIFSYVFHVTEIAYYTANWATFKPKLKKKEKSSPKIFFIFQEMELLIY